MRTEVPPRESKLRTPELSGKTAVPPHQTHFLPSNQPYGNHPLRDARAHHHPLCSDTAFLTSLQIVRPTRYSNSSLGYGMQVCFAPLLLFAMDNVDGWIDFLVQSRRSLGGFGGVTRMDDEQDGPGLGRYRHHTCYRATTCNSNTLNSTYSSYLCRCTEHQGAVDVKSQRLVLGSAQQLSPMGCQAFERPKDQGVEMIMLNSCALNGSWDVNEALGVWRKRLRAQQKMRLKESGKGGGVGG